MPLPMVHLWIAVHMAEARDEFPSPEFLLGSIAPDAVHMRPDYERAQKRRSHLNEPRDNEEHDQVRAFVEAHVIQGRDPAAASYAAGYAAHVLTDRFWLERIHRPFRERNAHLSREDLVALYYRETDQVDFHIYHRSPWRERVWKALETAAAPEGVGIVTPDEVDQWRRRTLRWFTELCQEPGIVPSEITHEMVSRFVEEASTFVARRLGGWGVDGLG